MARILKTMGGSSVKNSRLAKTNKQTKQLSTHHLFLHNTIINVAISKDFDNFIFISGWFEEIYFFNIKID